MYTQMWPSDKPLTSYKAVLWIEVGQPWIKP